MSNVSFARRTWFAATVGTCVPRWLLGTGLSHQSGTELPTVDAASLRAMKRRKDQAGQNALILDAASGIAIALFAAKRDDGWVLNPRSAERLRV
jgi:hypothetical protein